MTTIVESLTAATQAVIDNAAAYQDVAAATKADQVSVIQEAGIDTNDVTLTKKLLRAIRGGLLLTFVDVGAANAIVINPPTSHTVLHKGLPLRIWPAFTNTDGVTVKVNTLAAVPLLRADGSALGRGDVVKDRPLDIVKDGNGNFRIVGLAPVEVRRRLLGDLTVTVRPDGSDMNDGSANSPDKAFKTLQGCWNALSGIYDTAGYSITIVLGVQATYAGASFGFFAGRVRIMSASETSQSTIISPAGAGYVIQSRVQGLELVNVVLDYTYAGPTLALEATVWAAPGGTITCTGVSWRNAVNRPNLIHNYVDVQAAIQCSGGQFYILGAGSFASFVSGGAFVGAPGNAQSTFTTQGTMTITDAWCVAGSSGSNVSWYNCLFTNAFATGKRYRADRGGSINVAGGGENVLPGSVAGEKTNGGIYA